MLSCFLTIAFTFQLSRQAWPQTACNHFYFAEASFSIPDARRISLSLSLSLAFRDAKKARDVFVCLFFGPRQDSNPVPHTLVVLEVNSYVTRATGLC